MQYLHKSSHVLTLINTRLYFTVQQLACPCSACPCSLLASDISRWCLILESGDLVRLWKRTARVCLVTLTTTMSSTPWGLAPVYVCWFERYNIVVYLWQCPAQVGWPMAILLGLLLTYGRSKTDWFCVDIIGDLFTFTFYFMTDVDIGDVLCDIDYVWSYLDTLVYTLDMWNYMLFYVWFFHLLYCVGRFNIRLLLTVWLILPPEGSELE